ncbi:hypothetical protein NRIC_07680 [Enterococcus florum]|uniref:VWFA domain-containing protein n=1 Tax=Enterococcus florum TaxID=2480627 RepID=A0A4P5P4X8_9ENTE|nr:VWA domain-containing protein [Enterococcus florum]GCF92877.1 hypothetical protein NRIC_07680 [Enterococcus florum]
MLLSLILEVLPLGMQAIAETTKTVLIDEDFLSVSYEMEATGKENVFRIKYQHDAQEENHQQRLKLQILDEDGNVIDYPTTSGMEVEDGWFIEKSFTPSAKKEFSITIPKSQKRLQLFVEMDEQVSNGQKSSKKTTNQNILGLGESFWLEVPTDLTKSSEEPAKKSSSAKSTKASKAASSRDASTLSTIYTAKIPEYTEDTTGKYPKHPWVPENQTNVINHQGGQSTETNWDGVTQWDVANDDNTKSYIHYGNKQNPNLSMRALAKQTDVKNEFDVQMNVRGHLNYEPGVDIVFLLDNSKSMDSASGTGGNRKANAVKAMGDLVEQISKLHVPSTNNIRVGATIFSDFMPSSDNKNFAVSGNPDDWKDMVAQYGSTAPEGGTFTERGLAEANDLFESAGNRKKLLFVLTDGVPTYSWEGLSAVQDSDMYYDQTYITDSRDKDGSGNYLGYHSGYISGAGPGSTTQFAASQPRSVDGHPLTSHITTTNSRAKRIKAEGVEIHSLAFNIAPLPSYEPIEHSIPDLLRGLYKMSSKKANATGDTEDDYFFYNAGDSTELGDYITNWYDIISRTVDQGEIINQLGDMYEVVGNPTVQQVKAGEAGWGNTIPNGDLPKASKTNNDRTIEVKDINLSAGQEIQVNYKVRLKTTQLGFKSEHWYPIHKSSTLAPIPQRTQDILPFGIPSARASIKDFVIPVRIDWDDSRNAAEDFWKLRPSSAKIILQEQDDNGTTWSTIEEIELTENGNWSGSFPPVMSGPNYTYRIVQQVGSEERVLGYAKPTYSNNTNNSFKPDSLVSNTPIVITNTLMTTNYSFKKFKHDGTPFTGTDKPKFTITRTSGTQDVVVETGIEPEADGTVTVTGLPVGTYKVEETHVPSGYAKMTNFNIEVKENSGGTAVEASVQGQSGSHEVINRIADFELKVDKIDERGKALNGASFRLTGPNGYDQTKTSGSTFTFTGLKPGVYQLEETVTPTGFVGLDKKIAITIAEDGTVTIESNPLVTGSGGATSAGNKIDLKVKNAMGKVLPSTGGSGVQKLMLISLSCLAVGGSLGAGYLFLNKRRGSR